MAAGLLCVLMLASLAVARVARSFRPWRRPAGRPPQTSKPAWRAPRTTRMAQAALMSGVLAITVASVTGTVSAVVHSPSGVSQVLASRQSSRPCSTQGNSTRLWTEAHKKTLITAQCQSPLWLIRAGRHGGRPPRRTRRRGPAQVCTHRIDGQADAPNKRITDALGTQDTEPEPEPGDERDDDSEQAS